MKFYIQWCWALQWTRCHSYLKQLICSCLASWFSGKATKVGSPPNFSKLISHMSQLWGIPQPQYFITLSLDLHWTYFWKHYIYSVSPIYRGRVYRGIGYIAVACWTPFFWRPRARYFSRNSSNTLDPIRGWQFFAKSAHRDSLCSRFAGDNFSRNQLWPTCQYGLEHMLCDGQPSSAEHWHLHCIAE